MTMVDKTNDYTEEERAALWQCVVNAHAEYWHRIKALDELAGYLGWTSEFGPYYVVLKSDMFQQDVWRTLNEPFEDMPLHINDESIYAKATAIWRLSIGR